VSDPGGSRTRDLRIKSPLLYQLSYRVALRFTLRNVSSRVLMFQRSALNLQQIVQRFCGYDSNDA
jgi:hypothetical protein